MLTDKQEKYIQEIVAGKTQRQAYFVAYPKSKKWKPKTVDEAASKLFALSKVNTRYNELIERHKAKAIMTRDELLRGLKKAFNIACGIEPNKTVVKEIIDGNPQTVINRVSLNTDLKSISSIAHQISKLEGWEIDKVEHSGIINNNDTSNMTEEELELEIKKQQEILKRV